MSVRITAHGGVNCRATLDLNLSATQVWGQIRDFQRYAQQDFFHADIKIDGGIPRAGATLTLSHRYAGIRIERAGRILVWREGLGYSFSDLSMRGPSTGFPHVFSYRIASTGENSCRLHISVRGRWTAEWTPSWAAKLWLAWVFGHIVRSVDNRLMVYEAWQNSVHDSH